MVKINIIKVEIQLIIMNYFIIKLFMNIKEFFFKGNSLLKNKDSPWTTPKKKFDIWIWISWFKQMFLDGSSDRYKIYTYISLGVFLLLVYAFVDILFILSHQTDVMGKQQSELSRGTWIYSKLKWIDLDKVVNIDSEKESSISDFIYNINQNLEVINNNNGEKARIWNVSWKWDELNISIWNITTYNIIDSILLSFIYNKKY